MALCYLNGVDLETLGVSLAGIKGWAHAVEYRRTLTPVPGRSGGIAQGMASGQPRTITVDLLVSAASLAARQAVLDDIDGFCQGDVEIRFVDSVDRYCTGVLVSSPESTIGDDSSWWLPAAKASLVFECSDGAKYDTTESTVALSAVAADVPLGTLPSGGTVVITGPATNPVLTYKTALGATVAALGFTITLLGGQTLTLDLARITAFKDVGAGAVECTSAWTSGEWFAPSPTDGSFPDALWPTLTLSSGTGVYTYRRAWRR